MPPPSDSAAFVADALARNRTQSAEFGDELSNHLSMGVVALGRLGASAAEIERFERLYRERNALRPLDSERSQVGGHPNSSPPAGEAADVAAHLSELASIGRDAMLRRRLPHLLQGLGASAFHAMIRTAYGVEADDDAEVAFGLAYWSGTWFDLGRPKAPGDGASEEFRSAMSAYGRYLHQKGRVPTGRMIHARMRQAIADPAFAGFADAPRFSERSLGALAIIASEAFERTLDFTALHLVTSAHALRVLMPWIDDRAMGAAMYWRAMLAGYAAMGAPDLDRSAVPLPQSPAWSVVVARAIETGDDHAIKLVYSADCEATAYARDAYRTAAAGYLEKFGAQPLGNSFVPITP